MIQQLAMTNWRTNKNLNYIETMLSSCLKCRKNTEIKKPKWLRTKNGRIMLLSKCATCHCKKLIFIKEKEARRLLSSLGIKAPSNKIPLLGSLLL